MHVYQIIFTLGIEEGERVNIKVGALQGMYNGSEFIKELTKAYFGCRTKNLMIWCLRCFAETIGAVKIYAVSNQGHYAMNHYRRDRKLKVDMNKFWEECGGKAKGPKKIFYEIPLEEKRKKMEELKPSKRALHRRRFEKLDEIRKDIKENLGKVMHVR